MYNGSLIKVTPMKLEFRLNVATVIGANNFLKKIIVLPKCSSYALFKVTGK